MSCPVLCTSTVAWSRLIDKRTYLNTWGAFATTKFGASQHYTATATDGSSAPAPALPCLLASHAACSLSLPSHYAARDIHTGFWLAVVPDRGT